MKRETSALPDMLDGDEKKGKKLTKIVCATEIFGEALMIVNFLVFTRGLSYHRFIPFALELTLLIVFALAISVFDIITIKANRVARILGASLITSTFFYNVMDFFLGLALMGADDWQKNIPAFLCCTAVCLIKLLCIKNIFRNKHIRTYFYQANKAKYGL